MKLVCIDPIDSSKNLVSLSFFKDDAFCKNIVARTSCLPKNKQDLMFVCYDSSLVFDSITDRDTVIYDIKILYELAGFEFESLIDLSKKILGEEQTKLYENCLNFQKAHLRTYEVTKIDIKKQDPLKLLPLNLFDRLNIEKSRLVLSLFNAFKKDDILKYFRDTFYEVLWKLHTLGQNALDINGEHLGEGVESFKKVVKESKAFIKYNPVGTKHGRLTCQKDSFNILIAPKKIRRAILPGEEFKFVQFDFKSFQPRLAIAHTDDDILKNELKKNGDVYSLFAGERSKNKINFLKWMFSLDYVNEEFESKAVSILDLRNKIYEQALDKRQVVTVFGRVLKYNGEEKNVIFQNFITALEADTVFYVFCQMYDFLKRFDRKSSIAFLLHDAFIFKIHKDEEFLIDEIKSMMEKFNPVEVKAGENFGEMKKCS